MRDWMVKMREAKGWSLCDAAKACSRPNSPISQQLLIYLEKWGSRTQSVLAKQIGKTYGMTKVQIAEITHDIDFSKSLIPRKEATR